MPPVFKEAALLESVLAEVFGEKGERGEKTAFDKAIEELSVRTSKSDMQGLSELKNILLESPSTSIVFGPDLVQRSDGHRSLFAVAGLTYLLEARLYLLSEKTNEQGVIDAGCVPDMLPGGRPLSVPDFKHKFELEWSGSIPESEGKSLFEIIDGAKNKSIKALYVMGENPVFNMPDGESVKEALGALDFLVVQDLFLSETAELADVVLPARGWSERTGTFTNLERRVQLQKKAVETSKGMDDWRIISEVSEKMGNKMEFDDTEDIMYEMASVSPLYRDLTYKEISKGNSIWPYHGEPLRGEISEVPAASGIDTDNKADYYLAVEKPLYHSGTLSRRAAALTKICAEAALKVGSASAGKLGLADGDKVQISTSAGSLDTSVIIDDSIKDNRVYMSNNFAGSGVLNLMKFNIDNVTKAPGIEGCEVTIKKIQV
jgi:formate dehydrogenase major subunit/formate dehydrogenase alpha subunit